MTDIPTIACFSLFVALTTGLTMHFARIYRDRYTLLLNAKKEFTKAIESGISNCEQSPPHAFFYVYDGEVSRAVATFREALPRRARQKFDRVASEFAQLDRLRMTPLHRRQNCQQDYPLMSDEEARVLVLKTLRAMLDHANRA